MNAPALIVGAYGLLSLIGGLIGYAKARSAASLIAGSVSGVILLACANGLRHGSHPAAIASALVALALGGRFFGVWRRKRRVMPDLVMVAGAVMALLASAAALR